ncbi:MAG: hypothetical protein DRP64_20735 [Verrucomicrobia bacterium]|nr:MAG: hypothetical protein DRP64_20735 [Verrucomicrobiota bacterium]
MALEIEPQGNRSNSALAAVDTDTLLVVGQRVTDEPNDKQQLNPVLESIPAEVSDPENVLADTGYYSEEAVKKAEADGGPRVYCAMAKSGHHVSVADLEKHPIAFPPPPDAPMKEQMAHRLSMRGKEKAETEWCLVCLSYNLKKVFKLTAAHIPEYPAEAAKQHVNASLAHFRPCFEVASCMGHIMRRTLAWTFANRGWSPP